jgi:hypothetical protein
MEHLMDSGEAKTVFNNLIASGILKLYANYHSALTFGGEPKITKLPMNNEMDYRVAQTIFDNEQPSIYVAGILTSWRFRNDLGTASPTIAMEDKMP